MTFLSSSNLSIKSRKPPSVMISTFIKIFVTPNCHNPTQPNTTLLGLFLLGIVLKQYILLTQNQLFKAERSELPLDKYIKWLITQEP